MMTVSDDGTFAAAPQQPSRNHGMRMEPGEPILARAPHRIGKVALVTRDLAQVSRFYREVIGLRVMEEKPGSVRLGTGSSVLLELRHEPDARIRSPREAGLFHTAFLLPSRADLGAWLDFAAQRRVVIHGASDHLVSEAVYLSDPEGNGIEIYADRPSSAWPRMGDGMFAMPSEPLYLQDLLRAGANRPWSGFPEGGIVGHMHLLVGTIAPAENFYADLLGFDVTCRYPGGSFYGSGGYHHQLATNIWNSRGAAPITGTATGLAEFELIARDEAVVAATRERLLRAGYPMADGDRGLHIHDPWGIPIHLKASPVRGE
jgi:catechol 2,3-dioxygenase